MLMAAFGTVLPPVIILSVISCFYSTFAANPYVALVLRGMQAGVAAVILDVVCGLGAGIIKSKSFIHSSIMVGAFIAVFFLKINVIYVILAAAGVGVILALAGRKGAAK